MSQPEDHGQTLDRLSRWLYRYGGRTRSQRGATAAMHAWHLLRALRGQS
jgi:hypothetical protein